ncbi:MAG: hypothetical protein ACYTGX_09930 [Planctomycetota bacterium]|jgi:hypothetical protein
MARRSGGRSSGRGGARGGARKGGGRSRRDEYEEDDYDERPRRGGRRANSGPDMKLILGSVGGLILLLAIGGFLISSTEQARIEKERRQEEEYAAKQREIEEKAAAAKKKIEDAKREKEAKEAPWNKALEKILAPLKKKMNKDNKVKRYILAFSFANDRPTFYFPIRPKFLTGPEDEVRETAQGLCDLVEELCAKGFAHAEEAGYPVKDKEIIVHFKIKTTESDKKADPDLGKWKREVGLYKNGSLTLKR